MQHIFHWDHTRIMENLLCYRLEIGSGMHVSVHTASVQETHRHSLVFSQHTCEAKEGLQSQLKRYIMLHAGQLQAMLCPHSQALKVLCCKRSDDW